MSNYPDNMNWEAYDRIYDPQPLNNDDEPRQPLFGVERRKVVRAKTIWEVPAESVFCEWAVKHSKELARQPGQKRQI